MSAWVFVKGSKITQYVLIAIAVVALLAGVRQHYINVGKQQGKSEQSQSDQKQVEASHADDRKATATSISGLDQQIAKSASSAAAQDPEIQRLRGLVATLVKTQQAALDAAQRVPDADLHNFNRSLLNPNGTPAPAACYTPSEERAITNTLTAYPYCQQEVQKQAEAQGKTDKKISDLADEIKALNQKYAEKAAYTQRLEGYYAQIWNDTPHKKRAAHCLWLMKCGEIKLKVPPPEVAIAH